MTTKYFGIPFANSGDKTTIPDASQPSGDVSFEDGWTPDYSKDQTTDADAKDVPRQSENYFKFVVTEALKEIQEYGYKPYDALVNYPVSAYTVGSDGKIYQCIIANGPDSSVVDPVGDSTGTWVWKSSMNLQIFYTSGTYTPSPGVKQIEFTLVGGGGGGGGVDGQGSGTGACGGGGGGGGTCIELTSVIDSSYAITIGAGGAGGTGTGSGGGSAGGVTTVISTSLNISTGAAAGGAGDVGATSTTARGALGGYGSGASFLFRGGAGLNGAIVGGDWASLGNGGGTHVTGMNQCIPAVGAGQTGLFPGGGGSGGLTIDVTTDYDGGAGANGVVYVKELF